VSVDGDRVERIAALAAAAGVSIATSESLTCGQVATRLGEGTDAADWFRGGIVAYQESVKFALLGVDEVWAVGGAQGVALLAYGATDTDGAELSIPVKHGEGRYYAPDEDLDEIERRGQVAYRYAPGQIKAKRQKRSVRQQQK